MFPLGALAHLRRFPPAAARNKLRPRWPELCIFLQHLLEVSARLLLVSGGVCMTWLDGPGSRDVLECVLWLLCWPARFGVIKHTVG